MQLPSDLLSSNIKRGTILHSEDFDWIDHGKFFVVIGVSETSIAGFFFINSRIHPSIMNKQELLNMQYLLKASDYSFLRYDSFLSATNIIKKDKAVIEKSINNGTTKFVDNLKDEHLEDVLNLVRASKLFSNKDKRDFFS